MSNCWIASDPVWPQSRRHGTYYRCRSIRFVNVALAGMQLENLWECRDRRRGNGFRKGAIGPHPATQLDRENFQLADTHYSIGKLQFTLNCLKARLLSQRVEEWVGN